MQALTISQVTKRFGVSTRMLRYYEQIGLLESFRRDDYSYRMYNDAALTRLRQILILRKLRIPLKQIKIILQKADAVAAIDVFEQNIRELTDEIDALSTIRAILSHFVEELRRTADVQIHRLIAQDEAILASIESLSPASINFREDKTMEHPKNAQKSLSHKLNDVRILYLPPATVAAAHCIGDDPEAHAYALLDRFVRDSGLCAAKPDVRHYGFNHPNPVDETGHHGYEVWVTVPDDWQVPAGLTKKQFAGGLYAAHMIAMGNFHEWEWLIEWVNASEKYEFAGNFSDQEHMCGLLEEHLNYANHVGAGNSEPEDMQLDLLAPIRERGAKPE